MSIPIQILLVEDNPADADLLLECLSSEDSQRISVLNVVSSGEEALKYLRKENGFSKELSVNLVLLDLNLPGINGREVLEEIRKDPTLQLTPVVILTSSTSEEDILRSYSLHANAYIKKPMKLEDFERVVSSLLQFWVDNVQFPSVP